MRPIAHASGSCRCLHSVPRFFAGSCQDDPLWRDSKHGGSGESSCKDVQENTNWCVEFGLYSDDVSSGCPRSCETCPAGDNCDREMSRPHSLLCASVMLRARGVRIWHTRMHKLYVHSNALTTRRTGTMLRTKYKVVKEGASGAYTLSHLLRGQRTLSSISRASHCFQERAGTERQAALARQLWSHLTW